MAYFIGITVSNLTVANELQRVQEAWAAKYPNEDVAYVPPHKLHMTLLFCGPDVPQRVKKPTVPNRAPLLPLTADNINPYTFVVYWTCPQWLADFQTYLADVVGVPQDYAFRPHTTLVKSDNKTALPDACSSLSICRTAWHPTHWGVYRTGKALYEIVREEPL